MSGLGLDAGSNGIERTGGPQAGFMPARPACSWVKEVFLIDGLLCSVDAAKTYLQPVGVPEYPSFQAFYQQRKPEVTVSETA
jgi:hypothetical protein